MSQEQNALYTPQNEGEATSELVKELGLVLSDDQIVRFTVQEMLGIADGSSVIQRNPTAPYGHMTESVGAVVSSNGHDYI
ncbi:MAG: hypothetical protein ABI758_06710 [Candidatus Woesebacteria bacterium]